MTKHVSQAIKDDIVQSFTQDLESVINLASRWGLTRQAVYKILKAAGVDTKKGKIKVSCSTCGKGVDRPKSKVRNRKHIFCDRDCMRAYQIATKELSKKRANWSRVARRKISKVFKIKPEHVVHFVDGKHYNTMEHNMMVFANLGDHARWHRWGEDGGVRPLWRGDKNNIGKEDL